MSRQSDGQTDGRAIPVMRPHINLTTSMTAKSLQTPQVKVFQQFSIFAPQIQRGFPVDIVRNTNLLTYLIYLLNSLKQP